jgi:hypothetical protein
MIVGISGVLLNESPTTDVCLKLLGMFATTDATLVVSQVAPLDAERLLALQRASVATPPAIPASSPPGSPPTQRSYIAKSASQVQSTPLFVEFILLIQLKDCS